MSCNLHCERDIDKKKKTWKKNYGVENPFQAKKIKEKIKQTNLDKYGVEYLLQSQEIQEKIKQTNLERYGVENPLQSQKIQKEIKQVNLDKYGVEYPFQSQEIQEKVKKSNINNYGVENQFQREDVINIISKKNKNNQYNKLLTSKRFKSLIKPLFSINEYNGGNQLYKWQCMKCNTIFEDDLYKGHIPRCLNCYPKLKGYLEKELSNWLKSL